MSTRRVPGRPAPGVLPFLLACAALVLVPGTVRTATPASLLSVRFTGNASISGGDLRAAVPLRRGDVLSDSAVGRAVLAVTRVYRERSYFGARALPSLVGHTDDSSGADLLLTISEGEPAAFGRIEFNGAAAVPGDRLRALFGSGPGDPLTADRIESGLAALLREYDSRGYPFARAGVSGIGPEPAGGPGDGGGGAPGAGAMRVTVSVDEGGSVSIGEIRVEGNTETDRGVIVRESRMDLPVPYDPGRVSRFAQRLRRLGLFSSVKEPVLFAARPGHGLLVTVSEGRTNVFDGVVGYAPPPSGETGGSVTGRAAVAMRNLFGTGRKLEAEWARDGRSTQEIRLAYEEPWVFGVPVNLGAGFSQRQQDSTFVDRRVSASAEYLISASVSLAAVGEQKRIIPSAGPAGSGIPGSVATTGGVVLRYDTRDDRETPRRGVNYRAEFRSGARKPSGTSAGATRGTLRHIGFDLDLYLRVREEQVVKFGLHGREVSTASPEPGDLYRLGGFRTLRGFREDRYSGTRVAWGTVEYRFIVEGKSFFYGFLDPGYVSAPAPPVDLFTFGYGLGVRLETGLGLVGVSFALGRGDPVSETKIHFGLINEF